MASRTSFLTISPLRWWCWRRVEVMRCKTPLQLRSVRVEPWSLTARIVTLRLAETFVIARESRDEEEVAPGRAAARRRRRLRRGRGDRPLRGDGRRRRSPTSRSTRALLGDDPFALEEIEARLPAGQNAARAALDGALHDLQGKLLGVPVWKLLGLPRDRPADLVDGLARRPGRHGAARREGGDALPAPEAEARRRRRARRRARARRPRRHRPAAAGGRQRVVVARRGAGGAAAARRARRRLLRAAAPGGRRGREDAEGALADPDLRRRGLPPARQRRRLRGDRARDQHQAGEVGRHPRGDPDGARGARARARRHARLHDRVRARDRGRLRRRAAVRPRRSRRQPADRRRSVARRRLHGRRPGSLRPAGAGCREPGVERPERLLLLAEGFSGDPHYGKTARGVLAYGERQVVALLDSTRAGETQAGVPIVGDRERRPLLRADDGAGRRRDPGRPLPAGLARAPEELHREGPARRERAARVPDRRSGADRAGGAARRRAARPAPPAGRPERPHGREPDDPGADRAHGRLGLRDREDDRLARARAGGAGARDRRRASSRPARRGSRSRAGGSPSTRSSPTSSPARPSGSSSRATSAAASCCSSRDRERSPIPRTPASRSG